MGRYDALLGIDQTKQTGDTNQANEPHHEDGLHSLAQEPQQQSVQEEVKPSRKPANVTRNITSNTTDNITSSITLLQSIDSADIDELREPATQVQSFRLTDKNKEWLQEITYRLNKETRRGRITQADILRLAFKILEKVLSSNKAELKELIEKIK